MGHKREKLPSHPTKGMDGISFQRYLRDTLMRTILTKEDRSQSLELQTLRGDAGVHHESWFL